MHINLALICLVGFQFCRRFVDSRIAGENRRLINVMWFILDLYRFGFGVLLEGARGWNHGFVKLEVIGR